MKYLSSRATVVAHAGLGVAQGFPLLCLAVFLVSRFRASSLLEAHGHRSSWSDWGPVRVCAMLALGARPGLCRGGGGAGSDQIGDLRDAGVAGQPRTSRATGS
jgi:hypothetical protein